MIKNLINKTPLLGQSLAFLRYQSLKIQIRKIDRHEGDHPVDAGGIAVPPAELRYRVHGNLSQKAFLNVGKQVADNIKKCIERAGEDYASFHDILDFGCGSGRVIRYFLADNIDKNFTAIDINQELIDWCTSHIGGVEWRLTPSHPPTGMEDNSFDFIYGVSVFSHLDQELQALWLKELSRLCRPGGLILLTIHGMVYADHIKLAEHYRQQLHKQGFLFLSGVTGKWKLDGLPDFYQTAIQTTNQVQTTWNEYFQIVGHFEGAINQLQDAVLLKARI
jgi:2-polyprenyl-3-methyl-5-hydroxy-6-metoxy-1,4-benzoquinol methylase